MRNLVLAMCIVAAGCERAPRQETALSNPTASAPAPTAPVARRLPSPPPRDRLTLTQASGGAQQSPEVSIADATQGIKGKGPLLAKLDIETTGLKGTINCELFENQAPKTVANFVSLARGLRPWLDPKTGTWVKRPLYDGTVFHRVIPEFMIQGGDPKGNGTGDPGYAFADEFKDELRLDKGGVLAMANRGPNTNGSQFFITEKETPWLNGRHTVFGQCDNVMLVKKLARVPAGPGNRPTADVVLKKVTILRGPAGGAKK
ncbi:MAG TPA: peptidylprolyl isomerase [Polyangia bacterium]|jgi:peptidyl-prolyl cis-trans isomerase A (cyclophilin A)|nr:peptidylprolyl isomerase [Polyangia bacterium]